MAESGVLDSLIDPLNGIPIILSPWRFLTTTTSIITIIITNIILVIMVFILVMDMVTVMCIVLHLIRSLPQKSIPCKEAIVASMPSATSLMVGVAEMIEETARMGAGRSVR
eukprot:ANDGO_05017.mRNA.1 hypothetical protein